MKNQNLKSMVQLAACESNISAESVLQELVPLIQSYFISLVSQEGKKLYISILNGQRFLLEICETE